MFGICAVDAGVVLGKTVDIFAVGAGIEDVIWLGFAAAGEMMFKNSPTTGLDRAAVMTAVRTRLGTVAIDCHRDLGATVTFSGSAAFGAACASTASGASFTGADSADTVFETGEALRATGVPAISFHHAGYVGTTDSAGFCDGF